MEEVGEEEQGRGGNEETQSGEGPTDPLVPPMGEREEDPLGEREEEGGEEEVEDGGMEPEFEVEASAINAQLPERRIGAWAAGRIEVRAAGWAEGLAQGREEGNTEGRAEGITLGEA